MASLRLHNSLSDSSVLFVIVKQNIFHYHRQKLIIYHPMLVFLPQSSGDGPNILSPTVHGSFHLSDTSHDEWLLDLMHISQMVKLGEIRHFIQSNGALHFVP